jgi:hypothetical protein
MAHAEAPESPVRLPLGQRARAWWPAPPRSEGSSQPRPAASAPGAEPQTTKLFEGSHGEEAELDIWIGQGPARELGIGAKDDPAGLFAGDDHEVVGKRLAIAEVTFDQLGEEVLDQKLTIETDYHEVDLGP